MRRAFAALLLAWLLVAGGLPAAAPSDPGRVVAPEALARAATTGTARVLVVFRGPEAPSGSGLRQAEVAAGADAVLARLPAAGHVVHRRFATVPALVLEADPLALRRLAEDPMVLRVDLDGPGRGHGVAPDEASVLNGVALLADRGLDGSGRKVAVVDSGVHAGHPDLAAQLVDEQCFCSSASGSGGCCPNRRDRQAGPGAARDDNGHGTNIAGIILGAGGSAPRGAVPAARLVAVKVLDRGNAFCCTSDVVAALDWIAVHHPDVSVVNMSLGTNALYPGDCDGATAGNRALATAIDTLTALGAVVTASTGNQGQATRTAAPACIRNTVGVGATWDADGGPITYLGCSEPARAPWKPTCFSNRSSTTDLYAAGALVTSTGYTGGTSVQGGTSQASAMVAGCAVALSQLVPAATAPQRALALRSGTRTVQHGAAAYPLLDCPAALRRTIFATARACAAGAPTCCGPGDTTCTGGMRPVTGGEAPPAAAHADSTGRPGDWGEGNRGPRR